MKIKQILLVAFLIAFAIVSFANDNYITTSDLNVRTGAGKQYSVSFTLQKGSEVEVLSKENDWCKISYFGRSGYVYSKHLEYSRFIPDTRVQTTHEAPSFFGIWVFIVLVLLVVFFFFGKKQDKRLLETVTDLSRGEKSERYLVLKFLKSGMPSHVIFHDLYLEKQKGHFSQIDLVMVTDVGIMVFEVKDYSGWIYGNGNQSMWTQVLAYGKQKYRFYNPVMQNNKHVTELRKKLTQFGDLPFYSIVVFYGDCVLKEINFVPDGTLIVSSRKILDVVKKILKKNEQIHYHNASEIFRALTEAVVNGGIIENQIKHKENIKDMLGKHRIFD